MTDEQSVGTIYNRRYSRVDTWPEMVLFLNEEFFSPYFPCPPDPSLGRDWKPQ